MIKANLVGTPGNPRYRMCRSSVISLTSDVGDLASAKLPVSRQTEKTFELGIKAMNQ